MTNETKDIRDLIRHVESTQFRTESDTGATPNTLLVWNMVREFAGLPRLEKSDLPAYCVKHGKYHVILADYGCERKTHDQ